MGLVKTFEEIVRDQLNRASDQVSSQFIGAIKPIYGATEKGRPEHIGTCTFIRVDNREYMLTAAHILDESRETNMYVGVNKKLVLLTGTFQTVAAPNGRRADDHYDFGWQSMDSWDVAANGVLPCISTDNFDVPTADTGDSFYLALGYPNSKNKKHDHVEKFIVPTYMRYSAKAKSMPDLCVKLGVTGREHLFIPHDKKHSKNESGEIVNSLAPRGSSGGALVSMGAIASVESLMPGHVFQGALAGILIENSKLANALVAVRIQVIVDEIRRHELQG